VRTVVFTRVASVAVHKWVHHFLIALERHSPPPSDLFTAGKQRPVSISICSLRYFSVSPFIPRGYLGSRFLFRIARVCWSRGPCVRITQKYSRTDKAAGSLIRKLIERRGTLVEPLTSKLLTTTTRHRHCAIGAARGGAEIVQIFESISRGFNRRKLPSLYPKSVSLSPISSVGVELCGFEHARSI